jgi:hypothetical protein
MKIHALQTGNVRVKHSFLFPAQGLRRQLGLFMPGAWSQPLPIHCWAIEHEGLLRLDVYRAARIRAAERGSSVSALVAEYLRSLSEREAEFSRLEAQQKRIQRQVDQFSARDRIDRDQLHARAVR